VPHRGLFRDEKSLGVLISLNIYEPSSDPVVIRTSLSEAAGLLAMGLTQSTVTRENLRAKNQRRPIRTRTKTSLVGDSKVMRKTSKERIDRIGGPAGRYCVFEAESGAGKELVGGGRRCHERAIELNPVDADGELRRDPT